MPRISIVAAMWYVAFIAVGLAALRNANDLWAGSVGTLTLATLGVAILRVRCERGSRRNWWLGFALFGSGYLLTAFGPLLAELRPVLPSSMLSTYLRGWTIGPAFKGSSTDQLEKYFRSYNNMIDIAIESKSSDTKIAEYEGYREQVRALLIERRSPVTQGMVPSFLERKRAFLLGIARIDGGKPFETVLDCLSALIAGMIGAVISVRLARESSSDRRGGRVDRVDSTSSMRTESDRYPG